MTDYAASPSRRAWLERPAARLTWVLLGPLLALLALRLQLVFAAGVNWDEFFYLSKVHAHLRGELGTSFQSFQVHLFGWLAAVSDNEVDQVIAARLAVFALSAGSAGLLYVIGRRFLSVPATLFALLCHQGFSYLVAHGSSFRADPLCAFLLLACIALLLMRRRPSWAAGLAGLCAALAVLVSIKSLLFAPLLAVILAVLAWPRTERRAALRDAALFLAAALPGGLLLYGLHRLSLPETALADATGFASQAAGKMFLSAGFFPRLSYFLRSLFADPLTWLAMAAGCGFALRRLFDSANPRRGETLLLLAFLTPLLVLPVYRNAFPYFYVFVLAPGVLLAGYAFDRLRQGRPGGDAGLPLVAALVSGAVVLGGLFGSGALLKADETAGQRALVAAVHRVFPEPVPYIDWAGMIARYPKVGFFMSRWGLEDYRAAGRPVFRALVARHRPPFLLTDFRALDLARPLGEARGGPVYRLLPEDDALLKANYLPHWGQLWVAGKRLAPDAPGGAGAFEILIPGRYRLEAGETWTIDGAARAPGAVIALAAGRHLAVSGGTAGGEARLRWAEARPGPEAPGSDRPVYRPF